MIIVTGCWIFMQQSDSKNTVSTLFNRVYIWRTRFLCFQQGNFYSHSKRLLFVMTKSWWHLIGTGTCLHIAFVLMCLWCRKSSLPPCAIFGVNEHDHFKHSWHSPAHLIYTSVQNPNAIKFFVFAFDNRLQKDISFSAAIPSVCLKSSN